MTTLTEQSRSFEDANAALTANLADNPATSYASFADYKHGFFDGFVASRTQLLALLESPELVEEVASAIDSNAFIGTKSPRHHVSHWENVFEKRKGRARKLAQSAISTIINKLTGEK